MTILKINNTIIKAIVFDYNGTLAKLNIDFHKMRQSVLELIASYDVSPNDLPADHILETIHHAAEIVRVNTDSKADSLITNAYELIRQQEIAAACQGELFEQTRYLLSRLDAAGIATAVITRNCLAAINIEFPDISSYCRAVICRDHVTQVKPHPEHLNKALQMLGIKAANSLMVGDHPLDIKTGKAVGTFTAGVLTGNSRKEDFRQVQADLVLSCAADLLDLAE